MCVGGNPCLMVCRGGRVVGWDWGENAHAGGRLGSNCAQMCMSKSEGHGSFFSFKGVK